MRRRTVLTAMGAVAFLATAPPVAAQTDGLPSWNDGPVKRSILDFIARTTTPGGSDWVPVPERIACFDNDGTLWTEQPVYFQVAFAFDRIKALATRHPEWRTQEPFRSVLADDRAALAALGLKAIVEVIEAAHAGMTTEDFTRTVVDWLETARHPRFDRPYTDLVYQPMIELLALLRARQFKTFIVSGGGIEFMRPWTERIYGIPPEQVVGTSSVTRFEVRPDGTPVLMKEAKVEFIDDGPGKPVGINRFIGRRPVLAFGNSDGDQQMLEWTKAGNGARLALLVHHDDAEREYAYGADSKIGTFSAELMAEARQRGWIVVSMQRDWKRIFAFEK